MRIFFILFFLLFFIACGSDKEKGIDVVEKSVTDDVPMLIREVKKCSRLYTSEYNIRKIVTYSDEPRLKGKLLGHAVRHRCRKICSDLWENCALPLARNAQRAYTKESFLQRQKKEFRRAGRSFPAEKDGLIGIH